MQVSDINYNCHQKSDAMTTSSQTKDVDVSLLVACKVQLSSEVIRWKTESLRLQKECNNAQQKSKDLDQMVSNLMEKTKNLEGQLSHAKEENKHLRLRNILVDDKSNSIQRLSQNFNKYNSFPTSSNLMSPSMSRLLGHTVPELRPEEYVQEDWKQVSQNMLQRMTQEMKELQEMSACFVSNNAASNNGGEDLADTKGELEEALSELVSEAGSLKQHLLGQQRKLHLLISNFGKDCVLRDFLSAKKHKPETQLAKKQLVSTKKNHTPSYKDVNLIKPLQGISDLHIVRPSNAWNYDDDLTLHQPSEEPSEVHMFDEERTSSPIQDRVCPICQELFNSTVPQSAFEEHVFNHLDAESESFLEQYVVL